MKAECILFYSYNDRKLNDWFLVMNKESSGMRKNENLHALYSILDYCEEPFICRRKLQLSFLGEEFDESKCNRQCDNCKKHLDVIEEDLTEEATKIVKMVQEFREREVNVTLPQALEILKGEKSSAKCIPDFLKNKFSGKLKSMQKDKIRRLILNMLKNKILKENFSKIKAGMRD